MGTQPRVSPPAKPLLAAAMLVAVAASAACGAGGTDNVASHSPSPAQASPTQQASSSPSPQVSPIPTPQAVTGAYGVLVSSQSASAYTVSLVGINGNVVASAETSTPTPVSCANAVGAPVPLPVSTSNTRAYYMDVLGGVWFIAPNGDSGRGSTVPMGTASRRSMFAVSPDDQRIAVVVADYTSNGASTRLYVEDLNRGAHHLDLFSETGARTLWPIGWRGTNNLVVAVVPSCAQGGGPLCCGPIELHVIDPDTATRRFTLGSNACHVAGAATPAGVACVDTTTPSKATVLSWTAAPVRILAVPEGSLVHVSPDGSYVAVVGNSGTQITAPAPLPPLPGVIACAWIDDQHLLSGGDPQHQPRIGNVTNGSIVPVAAQGDCGGRIPGSL